MSSMAPKFCLLGYMLLSSVAAQVELRATVTQLLDGVFCWTFCTGAETIVVSADDLPAEVEFCGHSIELISYNPNTNILEVDGDIDGGGGRATVNIAEENYVYTDAGQCFEQLHVTINDEDPLDYDEDVAYEGMSLVNHAFAEGASVLGDSVTADGYHNVTVFTFEPDVALNLETEVLAFTAVHEEHERIVITFRGSNSAAQVIAQVLDGISIDPIDFGAEFCRNCDVEVLEYFAIGADGLLDAGLRNAVAELVENYPTYDVVFTGYSLGGSMANIAALYLRLEGALSDDVLVYTFGQPRTGNGDFADNYNRLVPNTYRIVYNRDIVPRMPFCELDCAAHGPNHVGIEVWYLESQNENDALCGHVVCEDRESLDCARAMSERYDVAAHIDGYFLTLGKGFCGAGVP